MFILIGCSKSSSSSDVTSDNPETVHKNFLYYVESEGGDGSSYEDLNGDLYIKEFGKEEAEKIDGDVLNSRFAYVEEWNKVYYITTDFILYEYEIGGEKNRLAEDVNYFNIGNEEFPIAFTKDNYDLFVVKKDGESEKISSNVRQVEIIDEDVYYANENGRFTVYNTEDRTETEIASQVYEFKFINDNLDLIYLNEDNFLYYYDAKAKESSRISSDSIYYLNEVHIDGKQVIYLTDNADLYMTKIDDEMSPKRIASDVHYFVYEDDTLYYVNNDDNLFKMHKNDVDPTRLASEVSYFNTLNSKELIYKSLDNHLNKIDEKLNNERVATEVVDFHISTGGDIAYITEDRQLFINDQKIAGEFINYQFIHDNLVYSTKDNQIILIEDLKDEHIIEEDASKYDYGFYYEHLVYTHYLSFANVAGTWESTDEIIEITEGGKLTTLYPYDDFYNLRIDDIESEYVSPRTIYAYTDEIYNDVTIRKISEDEITVSIYGSDTIFRKTDKGEVDKRIQNAKEERDKEEITYLMDGYIYDFPSAVNYGNFYYISHYIEEGSALYKEQESFIEKAYEQNIGEELVEYDIKDIVKKDEDTYEIKTVEKFIIWQDGESNESTYNNTYTAKRVDGHFLLSDIAVSVN